MGCCSDLLATLPASASDITQHVNYAQGMVLGVDDFTQEFTYLAGRDQWLAAELAGYGTTNGLAVTVEDTAQGVQLRVTRGAAALSGGQLVCVPSDRCAALDAWLGKPESLQAIDARAPGLLTGSPPGSIRLPVYVRLCYADCLTAMVPVPGEICRSDEDLMAPSRVADSFSLTLDLDPPDQAEEDALKAFVSWLRSGLMPGPAASPPLAQPTWLVVLRSALAPWFASLNAAPIMSPPPPVSLADYLVSAPPPALGFVPGQLADVLRVALRFWVTELRPKVKSVPCKATAGDCLLLGRLDIPIRDIGNPQGRAWQVDGMAADIAVIEDRRPVLGHLRLLQEWLLSGGGMAGSQASPALTPSVTVDTGGLPLAVAAEQQALILQVDAPQDITLPAISPGLAGRTLLIKNAGPTAAKIVMPLAPDRIDGAEKRELGPLASVTLLCDGVGDWHVIGQAG